MLLARGAVPAADEEQALQDVELERMAQTAGHVVVFLFLLIAQPRL